VLLRDDKSFPFILLREDHEFPRVQKHRGARRIKGQYYGPFASAGSVTRTLNALQKLFLLRSCSDSFFANRSRPCLLYQIKRCSAPCVGRISDEDYGELVGEAKEFLAGKSTGVQARLSKQMAAAAEKQDYELAAVYRDRLRALTYIQGSQTVHAEGLGDADVFALACKAGTISIQAFFIRGGQNWGHRAFFPAHVNEVPEAEVFSSFLVQFYEDMPPPKRILVDRDLPDRELLEEALSARAERKVVIERPQRGARRKLLEQAQRNAEEALDRRLAETTTQGKILRELADMFELADVPKRIEVYDNSHIMGTNATGAMIVAGPEGFRKNSYRKFNIKRKETQPGDDFAMMREVLERRFARLEKEDPDRASGEWPPRRRRRQGTAPWPRRARGLPPPRRSRDHASAELGIIVLSPAVARRSSQICHRHASCKTGEESDDFNARRSPRHRTEPQAGIAHALRDGSGGERGCAR
jgi:excinuclease ABC subunit C